MIPYSDNNPKIVPEIAARIAHLKQLGVEPVAIFCRYDTLATIAGELGVPTYSSPAWLMGLPVIVANDRMTNGYYIGV